MLVSLAVRVVTSLGMTTASTNPLPLLRQAGQAMEYEEDHPMAALGSLVEYRHFAGMLS